MLIDGNGMQRGKRRRVGEGTRQLRNRSQITNDFNQSFLLQTDRRASLDEVGKMNAGCRLNINRPFRAKVICNCRRVIRNECRRFSSVARRFRVLRSTIVSSGEKKRKKTSSPGPDWLAQMKRLLLPLERSYIKELISRSARLLERISFRYSSNAQLFSNMRLEKMTATTPPRSERTLY